MTVFILAWMQLHPGISPFVGWFRYDLDTIYPYYVCMQDGPPFPSRYHAFLLRLFQPEPEAPWQIILKTTDQDQPVLFRDAKALLEFLVMLMEMERTE